MSLFVDAKNFGFLFLAVIFLIAKPADSGEIGVCNRLLRPELSKLAGKPCDQVTSNDLALITDLTIETTDTNLNLLNASDFLGLANLRTMRIVGSNSYRIPVTFSRQPFSPIGRTLRELAIVGANLNGIDPHALRSFRSLESLRIYGKLRVLPDHIFHDMQQLKLLDLRANELTEISEANLDDLQELETLLLSRNRFSAVPNFSKLGSLATISLSENMIVRIERTSFENKESLRSLFLAGNPVGELPDGIFEGMYQLETLDISQCGLISLAENIFRDLKLIQTIRLDNKG